MINNVFELYSFLCENIPSGYSKLHVIILFLIWISRVFVFPIILSWVFVRWTITLSRQYDVMARPSSRGAHTIPTPRLGGVGSALAVYCTTLLFNQWKLYIPFEPWHLVFLVGGAWALVGGALDDFLELPPQWKQLLQIAPCGAILAFGFSPDYLELPLFGLVHLHPWASSFIALIASFLFMNIFNFMDGMDGHAALFGIVTGGTLALWGIIFGFQGNPASVFLYGNVIIGAFAAVLVASLIGLLYYNHPKQSMENKTFMGDSGSQFYGFCLAILAIQLANPAQPGRFPWIASFILFSPFIYDAAFTIVLRIKRGERLSQAHKSHLYQRLMVAGWSHGKALLLCCAWWVVIALLAVSYASATAQGHAVIQFLVLFSVAAVLFGFTQLVISIEKTEARKKKQRELSYPSV